MFWTASLCVVGAEEWWERLLFSPYVSLAQPNQHHNCGIFGKTSWLQMGKLWRKSAPAVGTRTSAWSCSNFCFEWHFSFPPLQQKCTMESSTESESESRAEVRTDSEVFWWWCDSLMCIQLFFQPQQGASKACCGVVDFAKLEKNPNNLKPNTILSIRLFLTTVTNFRKVDSRGMKQERDCFRQTSAKKVLTCSWWLTFSSSVISTALDGEFPPSDCPFWRK